MSLSDLSTTRFFICIAAAAAVLNPFAWYIYFGEEAMFLLYGDWSTGLTASALIVVGSIVGIVVGRYMAQYVSPIFKGLVARFGGAMVGALVPSIVLLFIFYVFGGEAPSFAVWLRVQLVSFIPLFVAYWIVHLLVERVVPSAFGR